MRSLRQAALFTAIPVLLALAGWLPTCLAAVGPVVARWSLKAGYSATGLLDRKFVSIQLIVEVPGPHGKGRGWVWDDPNIQPGGGGFFPRNWSSLLGEVPEGGKTGLDGPQYPVTLDEVFHAEMPKGSRLFRVAGLEVKELGVRGEVYLSAHRKGEQTVYRLFRMADSRGGKRVVESIILEAKECDSR